MDAKNFDMSFESFHRLKRKGETDSEMFIFMKRTLVCSALQYPLRHVAGLYITLTEMDWPANLQTVLWSGLWPVHTFCSVVITLKLDANHLIVEYWAQWPHRITSNSILISLLIIVNWLNNIYKLKSQNSIRICVGCLR